MAHSHLTLHVDINTINIIIVVVVLFLLFVPFLDIEWEIFAMHCIFMGRCSSIRFLSFRGFNKIKSESLKSLESSEMSAFAST